MIRTVILMSMFQITGFNQIFSGKMMAKENSQILLEPMALWQMVRDLVAAIQSERHGAILIMTETLIFLQEILLTKTGEAISLSQFGYATAAKKTNSNLRTRAKAVSSIRNLIQALRWRIMIMMVTLISFSLPFMELLPLVERIIQSSFVIREISNL